MSKAAKLLVGPKHPNVIDHTAKHFLGNAKELWVDLLPRRDQKRWDGWHRALLNAGCAGKEHPTSYQGRLDPACSDYLRCHRIAAAAAGKYASIAWGEFAEASQRGAYFVHRHRSGPRALCCHLDGGGILLAVAWGEYDRTGWRSTDRAVFLSAYRPDSLYRVGATTLGDYQHAAKKRLRRKRDQARTSAVFLHQLGVGP
jgi:hypothetical protein